MSRSAEKRADEIRLLKRLEENKFCVNCNERAPQTVCTTFNTFVCTICGNLHREFCHRVKVISFSEFTEMEMAGLRSGGNAVAKSVYFAAYKPSDFQVPDVNEPHAVREKALRELIRLAYVDRRWMKRIDTTRPKTQRSPPAAAESDDESDSEGENESGQQQTLSKTVSESRASEKWSEEVRKMKRLQPNKRCINCHAPGTLAICTTFNTFVCLMCAALHREFNHSIKSIYRNEFTEYEAAGLRSGGNAVAKSLYFATYKPSDFQVPDANEARPLREKAVRELIRLAYVDRRWVSKAQPTKSASSALFDSVDPVKPQSAKKNKKHESASDESSAESESDSEPAPKPKKRDKANKSKRKQDRKQENAPKNGAKTTLSSDWADFDKPKTSELQSSGDPFLELLAFDERPRDAKQSSAKPATYADDPGWAFGSQQSVNDTQPPAVTNGANHLFGGEDSGWANFGGGASFTNASNDRHPQPQPQPQPQPAMLPFANDPFGALVFAGAPYSAFDAFGSAQPDSLNFAFPQQTASAAVHASAVSEPKSSLVSQAERKTSPAMSNRVPFGAAASSVFDFFGSPQPQSVNFGLPLQTAAALSERTSSPAAANAPGTATAATPAAPRAAESALLSLLSGSVSDASHLESAASAQKAKTNPKEKPELAALYADIASDATTISQRIAEMKACADAIAEMKQSGRSDEKELTTYADLESKVRLAVEPLSALLSTLRDNLSVVPSMFEKRMRDSVITSAVRGVRDDLRAARVDQSLDQLKLSITNVVQDIREKEMKKARAAVKNGASAVGSASDHRSIGTRAEAQNGRLEAYWYIAADAVKRGRFVGEGAQGAIYECEYGHQPCVMKQLRESLTLSSDAISEVRRELEISRSLPHPSIVRVFGANLQTKPFFLVMERCEKGDLGSLLARESSLPFLTRVRILRDTATGLSFLHDRPEPVLHRDLKSANVLIRGDYSACVADFGMAKVKSAAEAQTSGFSALKGSMQWKAPELLSAERLDAVQYTTASDVFAFGVVCYEVLTAKLPWAGVGIVPLALQVSQGRRPDQSTGPIDGNSFPEAKRVSNPKAFESVVAALVALMRLCWAQSPDTRPTAKSVLQTLKRIESDAMQALSPAQQTVSPWFI